MSPMLRACARCGTIGPDDGNNNCPKHRRPKNAHWSKNRDRGKQAAFRKAVLARDNHTCQCGHHDPTGRTLRACHLIALADGGSYDPANGVTRCEGCDRDTDPHAR